MKKLSTLFVVALCALLPTLAKAQNVSAEKAELVCKRFVSEKRPDAAKTLLLNLKRPIKMKEVEHTSIVLA